MRDKGKINSSGKKMKNPPKIILNINKIKEIIFKPRKINI
jgi:hypothetical protein